MASDAENAIVGLAGAFGYMEVIHDPSPSDKQLESLRVLCRALGLPIDTVEIGYETGVDVASARARAEAVEDGEDPWPGMRELPDRPRIPTMASDLLPDTIRPWICDVARQACLPLEMVAVPAMVGLSSLIGRNLRVQPDIQSAWTTPPNLWGAIVGRPGTMKSHAISAGLSPLSARARSASEEYVSRKDEMRAKKIALESRLNALKRRKDPNEDEIAYLLWKIDECRSSERRYRTNDPTVEKLGELLIENPRGLLLVRDELSGWLRLLDRAGREGDREFYLEAWGGDSSYTVDRIGRGTLHIPALCLSVLGSIQPGKLESYVSAALSGGAGDDGLLQRLQLLVWPDDQPQWVRSCEEPNHEARGRAFQVFKSVDMGCSERVEEPVRFDDHAQAVYDEWRDGLEARLRSATNGIQPAFEAHISKYRGMVPSIACVIWVAEGGYPPAQIRPYDVQRAIRWSQYLELHARKVYRESGCKPSIESLASKLRSGVDDDGAKVRDISRAQWRGLTTPEFVSEAINGLETLGWIRVERVRGRGGSSMTVRVHPAIRRRLAGGSF